MTSRTSQKNIIIQHTYNMQTYNKVSPTKKIANKKVPTKNVVKKKVPTKKVVKKKVPTKKVVKKKSPSKKKAPIKKKKTPPNDKISAAKLLRISAGYRLAAANAIAAGR